MIKIEIEGFQDLMTLVSLFKHADDSQIKQVTSELNKATKTLVQAEKKDEHASTGSH